MPNMDLRSLVRLRKKSVEEAINTRTIRLIFYSFPDVQTASFQRLLIVSYKTVRGKSTQVRYFPRPKS
jgi:hypothetical protein